MNILILARISNSFTGDTIYKKPLGGSESALFYIANNLAAMGHKIAVFNNCGEEGIFECVDYRRFATLKDLDNFSKTFKTDILISFRDLTAFLFPIRAKKKIWWGHDDFSNMWNQPYPKKIMGDFILKFGGFLANKLADSFFVPSNWLGDILSKHLNIAKNKIFVARNGIHLPYFENNNASRNMNRLIYASVPDRGLDLMLDFFPDIRKAIPSAELHVFCGFDLGMIKKADLERAKKIYSGTQQPGVYLRGTVSQKELAEEFKRGALLVYPSHELLAADFYAETSCIVALQSQAAGTPVISSFRGALPESVKNGETGILIKGSPFSKEYKTNFIDAVVRSISDRDTWITMSRNAREHIFSAYSWKNIAEEWNAKFISMLGEKDKI